MPTYPGISSEAFRHPLDRQAEEALRNLPGFKLLASRFVEYIYERPQQVFLMGNNIKAGPRQYSTLYGIFRECVHDLDISPEPTLYVNQNPMVNSYALGHDHPYIVVNTGLMDLLNETELRTVMAHELGHIKCDHTILIQMAMWAMGAASFLGEITLGLGNVITTGLLYAFYEWRRKAELSADRAALLVMDDLNPILHTMMKLAGGSTKYGHEMSLTEFTQQSQDYDELDQDQLNQIYKFLIYNGGNGTFLSHPFPVERLSFIKTWEASEEYQRIKQGHYAQAGAGSVDVNAEDESDLDSLRRQIEELKAEIKKAKGAE
ncbi:M48 family metallopeptidase [Picosynechococcus sp. PCC 73109]|uniref:M48 family metallopeptidase n=1 Tax=Picosynechococcus sp. PCC 73109 TaxID=374982 RepID=UPI00074594EA|nr:M48 family metallopeptidase [Picosynechococcus sp. PCC 73109]AMA08350.1 peptidase M48 [Picosynechococcus sp. PCC 73109]